MPSGEIVSRSIGCHNIGFMIEFRGNGFESAGHCRVPRRFGGGAKLRGSRAQMSDLIHFITALSDECVD